MAPVLDVPPGVVTGDNMLKLFDHARANGYAIPAVNCSSSSTCNAVLEAAKKANSPVIIQVSQGGGQFAGGKGLSEDKAYSVSTAGSVALAMHVRSVAPYYGVPVVIHSDHCAKKLLPWFDQMLEADASYFAKFGEPLFSSHMLDLSEEPDEENISICKSYFEKMAPLNLFLEMEIGITGGEEDGVNNEDVAQEDLYTKPEEVWQVYEALSAVPNARFSVAAAFGNVHGVYAPGNVRLDPEILGNSQVYIADKLGLPKGSKPVYFVFHGGSGSDIKDIRQAIDYGVIKMNIDTDTQWSYWEGVKQYEAKNREYLQTQIGNPDGESKPNKKYYDPREMTRSAETNTVKRMIKCFEDLNCVNVCGLDEAQEPKNVFESENIKSKTTRKKGGLPVY